MSDQDLKWPFLACVDPITTYAGLILFCEMKRNEIYGGERNHA